MRKTLLLIFLFTCSLHSQTIFPGQTGNELLNNLVLTFKPATVLSYDDARDKMYAFIDNSNDSVECVYTGYKILVPYGISNPRDYTNAASPIMNAEHTWPRSKGAESGNPNSDLHHIFSTNGNANSARGSNPFDEIPDNLTDRWWKDVSFITSIPATQIDKYSEDDIGIRFEPREEHKGNVARAMFYFYTMYKTEADNADPTFFANQKDILFQWHKNDPVNPAEEDRNNQIAVYQDNKKNPFILDTTLVRRAYFSEITSVNDNSDLLPHAIELYQNYPNPFNPQTTITYTISQSDFVQLQIFDVQGRLIKTLVYSQQAAGLYEIIWNGKNESGETVSSGVFIYRLSVGKLILSKKIIFTQ